MGGYLLQGPGGPVQATRWAWACWRCRTDPGCATLTESPQPSGFALLILGGRHPVSRKTSAAAAVVLDHRRRTGVGGSRYLGAPTSACWPEWKPSATRAAAITVGPSTLRMPEQGG